MPTNFINTYKCLTFAVRNIALLENIKNKNKNDRKKSNS